MTVYFEIETGRHGRRYSQGRISAEVIRGRHDALDAVSRRIDRMLDSETEPEPADPGPTPEEILLRLEEPEPEALPSPRPTYADDSQRAHLHHILDCLGSTNRAMLWLYQSGVPQTRIAARYGCRQPSVSVRISVSLDRIKRWMALPWIPQETFEATLRRATVVNLTSTRPLTEEEIADAREVVWRHTTEKRARGVQSLTHGHVKRAAAAIDRLAATGDPDAIDVKEWFDARKRRPAKWVLWQAKIKG